ncbi:MAG TPA: orotidine-5'-phosphate decarboxylase [Candidatus Sulfotelmatobacter sp.]|nr:orotidine-5'-phosphate decarboxylase [Candidatus Sulfotelmatobacter sp.]
MSSHRPETLSPASITMRDRLIVALDVSTAAAAQKLVRQIGDAAGVYKVGLQLFTAEGPALVRDLVASGRRVFLDLKLHDIPNTVSHAVQVARELGAHMLTVHAGGGTAMLRAATEAADGRLNILAVTVLTSLTDEDMQETGISGRVVDQALRMAALAQNAGCQGIVSSPREALSIRKSLGEGFIIVTPGIRPAGTESNDQQRIATPSQAIANGASHIVVGRPITHADEPARSAQVIIAEMEQAKIHG